mgnify:CR=1 FL=1
MNSSKELVIKFPCLLGRLVHNNDSNGFGPKIGSVEGDGISFMAAATRFMSIFLKSKHICFHGLWSKVR